MIITGTSIKSSRDAFKLTQNYPYCLTSTAGVHPHDAKTCNNETIDTLTSLLTHHEVVAVGECGLDFDRNFSPSDTQELWFEEQLKLAVQLKKPVFLHERSAFKRFSEILNKYKNELSGGVVHCFTGTREELEKYLAMGMHIGITGWVTDDNRGKDLQKILKLIPLNKLMIETDAPFLKPHNMRSRVTNNEPAFLPFVLQKVAECMDIPVEHVAKATTANAFKFFNLK